MKPLLDDWLHQHQGYGITVSEEEAVEAAKALNHRNILDCLGCCPASLLLMARACPSYLAHVLTSFAKSQAQWKNLTLEGKVKAKKAGAVTAAKVRTILPLPALVGAMDYILAKRLNDFAET